MPSIQTAIFKLVSRSYPTPFEPDILLEERRSRLEAVSRIAGMLPVTTVMPMLAGDVPAEWVQAAGSEGSGVIIYLHGGAYTLGSIKTHRDLAARLSRASGMSVLLLDYRLAPEHPFPAAINDVLGAYKWLMRRGFPHQLIALAGDSAGGGLALASAIMMRNADLPLPTCLALISPLTDLTYGGPSIYEREAQETVLTLEALAELTSYYTGSMDPRHPLISPLYANLEGLPPTMIQVGSDEILYDDSTRMTTALEEAGVPVDLEVWDGLWHVFHMFSRYVPEGEKALDHLAAFIESYITIGARQAIADHW